jgi:hypothetical protein
MPGPLFRHLRRGVGVGVRLACGLGVCLTAFSPEWSRAHAADALADELPVAGAVEFTAEDRQQRLDHAVVYRYDPFRQLLVPAPRNEWKPGHVYQRSSERLGRHVWSIASADGRMEYALGPGSVHPARNFDLRVSEAERQRELEARQPELARRLAILGARPTARLAADGTWSLDHTPGASRVFDLETGQRWEWHGDRRTGVVHSGGNAWAVAGDRYRPAFVPSSFPAFLPVAR